MQLYQILMEQQSQPQAYVCVIGNDGTGKSTMCNFVNQSTKYRCVERSMKNSQDQVVKKLVKEIRMIDKLTYSYAFEDDWYNFDITRQVDLNGKKIKVFWVLLTAPTEVLFKRINSRIQFTVYQHEKCIKYFNCVYEEMAHFYGINLVKSDQSKQKTLSDIIKIVENSKNYIAIKDVTLDMLKRHDLELIIGQKLSNEQAECIYDSKVLSQIQRFGTKDLYFPGLIEICNIQQKKMLAARWIKNNATRQLKDNLLIFKFQCGVLKQTQQQISVELQLGYIFQKIIEGQSKILFKIVTNDKIMEQLFKNKVIILLKGTIYSHTNQRTSQIGQLGKIRAKGSMIFLQMLKRNQIKHSYISLNKEGIILSKFVETNNMEIVFKKQCLGTDKHSYFRLRQNENYCEQNGVYKGGIYVRFDWRNPNHILLSSPNILINQDPYYYCIQKIAGKQIFFTKFLTAQKCKPIGDKCITEDLVTPQIDTKKIKEKVIESYCTFQFYAHQVGLQILDGCMMIDNSCQHIWSQINPDCLRVKTIKLRQDYDKDIWRAGGSSSKETIMKKWRTFNQIFIQYFKNHRFMDSQVVQQLLCKQIYAKQVLKQGNIRPGYQYFYKKLVRGHHQRQLIGTIDIINGQPILVQSSQFKEKHSNANINQALQYASIIPQMLLVDIDGASDKPTNNRSLITSLSNRQNLSFYAVGGGIRTIQIANQYLKLFQHIVISSNLDIIKQLPLQKRKRIIVQLSINQQNEVLTHARTVNTGLNVNKKMVQLCQLGIEKVSITFNSSQGKLQGLPREQLRKLMYDVPGLIKNVIIAGGISSIDDLEFIWGFRKCIPQLGSAIWKKKVLIGEIYSKMARFNQNNLIATVVQDKFGKNLGLIYLNQQGLIKSCQERYLYRFSRQHNKLMKKGQQSGNTQKIISMNIDCDNDTLLVTVDDEHPIFCHLDTQSCFYQQINKSNRMGIQQLQQHILTTKNGGGTGYSHKLQNNPKLAIHKVIEQVDQLGLAQNKERKTQQCADVIAHLLMYMNSTDIKMNQVLAILNKRSKQDRRTRTKKKEQQNILRVGLAAGKHTKLIFDFIQQHMGVQILPHQKGYQRNYAIKYKIIDEEKFNKSLKLKDKQKTIQFISVKPKDLVKLMEKGYVQLGVNYSNVVQNGCQKFNCIGQKKMEGLRLALIKRKGENIEPQKWTQYSKGVIMSEYPSNTTEYFKLRNIPSNHYSLIKVSGHSQGYLSNKRIDYCDAIVLSGKTIQDNNLQIQAIIKSEIKVILFQLVD